MNTFSTQTGLVMYSFCACWLHSLIMWLRVTIKPTLVIFLRIINFYLDKICPRGSTFCCYYGHLSPITKTIQVRRTRHAGHCWRSKNELISDVLLWTPHMAKQKQDDQLEHTYSNYVRIRDVALKTCQRRWMIGRSGERGSGISVLAARHDDDDEDDEIRYSFSFEGTLFLANSRLSQAISFFCCFSTSFCFLDFLLLMFTLFFFS